MAQFGFKTEEQGYSISEVDRYILRLQEEYRNAVEWSNEIEKKSEGSLNEIDALRIENERLNSDCRILAAKLREIMQSEQQIESNMEDAAREASKIVENAERNASSIVSSAQAHSAQVIASAHEKAEILIREAEGKSASILQKAESECQSIIFDATKKIEEVNAEIAHLNDERKKLTDEMDGLLSLKENMVARVEEAKKLLNF